MKSHDLFAGYCETLRDMLDKMSDEEFGRENSNEWTRELLNSIGYKRNWNNEKE